MYYILWLHDNGSDGSSDTDDYLLLDGIAALEQYVYENFPEFAFYSETVLRLSTGEKTVTLEFRSELQILNITYKV